MIGEALALSLGIPSEIGKRGDVMRGPPIGRGDGRNDQPLVVGLAVLAADLDLTFPVVRLFQGGPQVFMEGFIMVLGFEQRQSFAHHLYRTIADQAGKGLIDPDDDAVGDPPPAAWRR